MVSKRLGRGLSIGRDRLFELLKREDMLVKRSRKGKGGSSSHSSHANLIKGLEVEGPFSVLVADITYIATLKGWTYLSLVTDLSGRKIMGEELSKGLDVTGSLKALKKALRDWDGEGELIHHSDRGTQYMSHEYRDYLKERGCWMSVSKKGCPYENAVAERVNGILKEELGLNQVFKDFETAKKAVKEAIKIYNEERPHMSLNYQVPEEVYQESMKARA
jgi:transposase InsO family protein